MSEHKKSSKEILFKIAHTVCAFYGVNIKDLNTKCRKREFVIARQTIWSISREILGSRMPFDQLGYRIGNKNHATVIIGVKTLNNLRETDKDFRITYDEVMTRCQLEIYGENYSSHTLRSKISDVLQYRSMTNIKIALREIVSTL